MNGLFLPLAAKRRRSGAGGGGPPPPGPFVFVSGFKALSVFGSRQGEVIVSGGTPPYTSVSVPFNNGGVNIPTSPDPGTGRFSWTNLSETVILLTVSDSAGGSLQFDIDYAGMSNGDSLPLVPAAFDPIQLFAAGGGVGTGVLLDTKKSLMFSDAGITPAVIGGPVHRIVDRVASLPLDQAVTTQQGILQSNGIQMDGVDDAYPAGFSMAAGRTVFVFGTLGPVASGTMFAQRNSGGVNFNCFFRPADGKPDAASGGVTWGATGGSDARSEQTSLAVRITGTKGEVFQDGVLVHTEDPINGSLGSAGPIFFSGVGGVMVGGMIITRALTDEEIAKVDTYWRAPPTPEEELVAFFATKRLGYVVDPRDKSTMLTTGSVPVTADGQPVIRASIDLASAATLIAYAQATVASQPVWSSNSIDPDGVDDMLIFPTGGTAVQPDFEALAGFVASILVTPGPNRLQTFWTSGFGGTNTNNRLSIQGLANGSVQFVVNDGVARRVFATPAGVLVPGTQALLTLFVDFQTREAKGFVDGVERASFTLLNTTDLVNANVNRARFFASHGTGEYSDAVFHRATFLHDRTDAAGRIIMENWVAEGSSPAGLVTPPLGSVITESVTVTPPFVPKQYALFSGRSGDMIGFRGSFGTLTPSKLTTGQDIAAVVSEPILTYVTLLANAKIKDTDKIVLTVDDEDYILSWDGFSYSTSVNAKAIHDYFALSIGRNMNVTIKPYVAVT